GRMDTLSQYNEVVAGCESVFLKKAQDYGTSWRLLRPISLVDQIYIKAWRIRQIQENKGIQKSEDSIENEFAAIINYGYIALIQSQFSDNERFDLPISEVEVLYKEQVEAVRNLMLLKNHDYGEAWR